MKVKILGKSFDLSEKESHSDLGTRYAGFIDHEKQTITVKRSMRADEVAITVLHEIVHAVDSAMESEISEKQTCTISRGLWAVLVDNPELVDALVKTLEVARTTNDTVLFGKGDNK